MLRLKTYATKINPNGTIFGGWIMTQAVLAGKIAIKEDLNKDSKLLSLNNFIFHSPLFLGDVVSIYANITNIQELLVEIKVYKEQNLVACTTAKFCII